jgi:hypothetical protein
MNGDKQSTWQDENVNENEKLRSKSQIRQTRRGARR